MKLLSTLLLLSPFFFIEFNDPRDGTVYTLIDIDEEVWIKENIKYTFKPSMSADSLSIKHDVDESTGVYYSFSSAKNACPPGFHIPNLSEWNSLISALSGRENDRQGKLVQRGELEKFDLTLGGMARKDTVLLHSVMGYYWTSSDTLKTYFKDPDGGDQRHLIGVHIWNSGVKDSINVEPTYMLAKTYESTMLMNCKCVKDQ